MADTSVSLSFDVWESQGVCPFCGSDDIEYDLNHDCMVCDWCGNHSAEILTDDMECETWLINDLDRFDYMEDYERENCD